MFGITVNIQGDEQAIAKLKKLEPAMQDFHEALKVIGDGMVHYFSTEVFASQGGQFGAPWTALSDATRLAKIKHYTAYAAVPLIATGKMKSSFEARAEARKLTITNTAPYFVYHQSSASRSKLPRRQMMGIDSKMRTLIKMAIEEDIHKKVMGL